MKENDGICKDYLGNPLAVGDEVVVLSSGNSSWRKGVVTKINDPDYLLRYKVQVEYNDHYYCNLPHYELKPAKDKIHFYTKGVRTSVDTFNVVKLLPEYLN